VILDFNAVYRMEDWIAECPTCPLCNKACDLNVFQYQYQDYIRCIHCKWTLSTWKRDRIKGYITYLEYNDYELICNPARNILGVMMTNSNAIGYGQWVDVHKSMTIPLDKALLMMQNNIPLKLLLLQ